MISLDYLRYHIKSKKYLLITILSATLLINAFVEVGAGFFATMIACGLLCFVLPATVSGYIHDKRAVDTFFSVNITRRQLVYTDMLFSLGTVYITYLISLFTTMIKDGFDVVDDLNIPCNILACLLGFAVLVVVNTAIYSLANSRFDGIVMLSAYHVLPFALRLLQSIFFECYVVGYYNSDIGLFGQLSPVYNFVLLVVRTIEDIATVGQVLRLVIALVVMLAIGIGVIEVNFIKRKVERAGTPSNNIFAYPFIIYSYTFLCMIGIWSNYGERYSYTIQDFFGEYGVLFIVLAIIFIVAQFVYKRKLQIDAKMMRYYAVTFVIAAIFCITARNTDGFGLSYAYPKDDPTAVYAAQGNYYDGYEDSASFEVYNYFIENASVIKNDSAGVYMHITSISRDTPLSDESVAIFEKMRKEAIENYRAPRNYYFYGSLSVYNNVRYDGRYGFDYEKDYYYTLFNIEFSVSDLLALSYDENIAILFQTQSDTLISDQFGNSYYGDCYYRLYRGELLEISEATYDKYCSLDWGAKTADNAAFEEVYVYPEK